MPRRYRNYNRVGGVSCAGLLLLMLLLINPFVAISVSALGDTGDSAMDEAEEQVTDNTEVDDATAELNTGIELYASTPSTVGIEFSPAAGSGSLTPTDSNGAKAKIDVQATVKVSNSGGFRVYVGSTTSDLVNGTNTIPTLSSDTSYANIPVNRWGYALIDNGTSSNDTTTYSPMPGNIRDMPIRTIPGNIKDEQTYSYLLSFAANISGNMPAGTYSNQVTLSVVSSPLEISDLTGLTNMQDMTSEVCSASAEGQSKQLKDTRDGKYYWVTKLADGKCWMTQNLDLDLSSAPTTDGTGTGTIKTFSNTDTDLNSKTSWTPMSGTYGKVTSSNILNDNTGQRSWSLGDYRITNPTTSSDCGSKKGNAADCTSQFTAYTTPTSAGTSDAANAHYILGNHYQWCAATAGCSGKDDNGTITSNVSLGANEQAADSICPKGWKLPTSNSTAVGSFGGLTATLPGANNTEKLTALLSDPYYFVRGGYVWQDYSLFGGAGNEGNYWSSTANSDTTAYYLSFNATSNISPSDSYFRQFGRSVRCIAR